MKKGVTLQDIADYCHLSKSMVAQVIRNPRDCKATAKTKALVANAVKELDYHPNLAAKTLSTNRSYTVGVMFPAVSSFYDELIFRLDVALEKRGYYGLFSYWEGIREPEKMFRRAFERMKRHGVDGIITCQYDESLVDQPIPVVTYGNERRLMDCVFPDKNDYARRAVQYLYDRGHREIGFIGLFGDIRYQKICNELKRLGLAVRPDWIIHSHAYIQHGYEDMRRILALSEHPTAIITHSDHMAMGALRAAREYGIRIPEDISLLSYDNLSESAYCNPPLTTFDQQYDLGAELLVDTLLKRIADPTLSQQKHSFVMPLVERESVKDLNCNMGK